MTIAAVERYALLEFAGSDAVPTRIVLPHSLASTVNANHLAILPPLVEPMPSAVWPIT